MFKNLSDQDKINFNFDVTKIKWKWYIMNFAYGIKRFILKEEAELPSVGYNDVITVILFKLNKFCLVNGKHTWRESYTILFDGQTS
jgi:hypothetical protein